MGCRLTTLPECLIDPLLEALLKIINAPFLWILDGIKLFLTQQPAIETFAPLWSIMIYIISSFYGLFILFAGFNMIISGTSPERRQKAKEWLQNSILMIFSVQASYLIYSLIAQLARGLTTGIINLIDPTFFLLTIDSVLNVSLEMILGIVYLIILIITMVLFAAVYLIASIGVVLFPFGIFLYFIPPLKDLGSLIINILLLILFLPFFTGLILLAGAELVNISLFSNVKILISMASFLLADIMLLVLGITAIIRSITGVLRTDVAKSILMVKGHFLFR